MKLLLFFCSLFVIKINSPNRGDWLNPVYSDNYNYSVNGFEGGRSYTIKNPVIRPSDRVVESDYRMYNSGFGNNVGNVNGNYQNHNFQNHNGNYQNHNFGPIAADAYPQQNRQMGHVQYGSSFPDLSAANIACSGCRAVGPPSFFVPVQTFLNCSTPTFNLEKGEDGYYKCIDSNKFCLLLPGITSTVHFSLSDMERNEALLWDPRFYDLALITGPNFRQLERLHVVERGRDRARSIFSLFFMDASSSRFWSVNINAENDNVSIGKLVYLQPLFTVHRDWKGVFLYNTYSGCVYFLDRFKNIHFAALAKENCIYKFRATCGRDVSADVVKDFLY